MKKIFPLPDKSFALLAAPAIWLIAGTADAAPGGRLGVLPDGYWQCGLPGDAMGAAFHVDDAASFATVPNSSYRARDGGGTYLLTGTSLTFTRGPLKGRSYELESGNRLRSRDGAGRLICNRRAHRGDNRATGWPLSAPSAADRD